MQQNCRIRWWSFVMAIALTGLCAAQQGGAGGFRGGSQGNQGGTDEISFPPENLDLNEWDSKSMILTQGDKVEWKIKGVPGQTLMATVRSEVFDPAIKIIDPKGKVVAENDDQYEGNQSPFIVFRFPDNKEYKLTVQNYRSSAGGRFMIYSQIFTPVDIVIGANKMAYKHTKEDVAHRQNLYVHFKAEAGKTYTIRNVLCQNSLNSMGLRFREVIGPTGVYKTDYRKYIIQNDNSPFFEAKTSGDFYAIYDEPQIDGDILTRLDVVDVQKMEPTGDTKIDLGPTGQKLLRFDVKRGDILHTVVEGSPRSSLIFDAHDKKSDGPMIINNRGFRAYLPKRFDSNDRYLFFSDDSEVLVLATSDEARSTSIILHASSEFPTWGAGQSMSDKLGLGETKFFVLEGKKGDIQRINGTADGFELDYRLITADGQFMEYVDPRNHRPATELRYEENRKYLVSVTSPSGGGSGSFSLHLDVAQPVPIELGKVIAYQDAPSLGTYALAVQAGVRYQLLGAQGRLGFTLIDENGDEIGAKAIDFGSVTGYYFTPPKAGIIRLKVTGDQGAKFRIDVHQLPDLG